MHIKGITLFGKHPAWSDHMFVAASEAEVSNLKRIFYDHSVIPALQGADDSTNFPEVWSLIAVIDSRFYYIVSVSSSDSIGRTRFPLLAAVPLPEGICLATSASDLDILKTEMHDFLLEMLVVPEIDDLVFWQRLVADSVKEFVSEVHGESNDVAVAARRVSYHDLASTMTRLQDGHSSLNLRPHTYVESCVILEAALAQFKYPVSALLILDRSGAGDALLLDTNTDSKFNLERYLKGDLPYLDVPADRIPGEVKSLLESSQPDSGATWQISRLPSLRLKEDSASGSILDISRKHLLLFGLVALFGAILIGFIFTGKDGDEPPSQELGSFPARDAWIQGASDYVEWIQPLLNYIEKDADRFSDSALLMSAVGQELNPFSVVNKGEVRLDLVKNPMNRIFRQGNLDQLNAVYANIDELKEAITAYYSQHQPKVLFEGLTAQGYQAPEYLSHLVDPAEPLMPEFGPSFVGDFARYVVDYEQAADVASVVGLIQTSAIEPLSARFPEHAQLMQEYLRGIIAKSKGAEDFSKRSGELSRALHLPGFVDFAKIDLAALAAEPDWQALLSRDHSKESVGRMVDLLQGYHKVDLAKFVEMGNSLRTATKQLQSQLESMKSDFPSVTIEQTAMNTVLSEVERFNAGIPTLLRIQSQYDRAQATYTRLSDQLEQYEKSLAMKHQQLADPATWIQALSPQLAAFKSQSLTERIRLICEDLKRAILAEGNLSHTEAYQLFKVQADRVIEIFSAVDAAFMSQQSERVNSYLDSAGAHEKLESNVTDQLASTRSTPLDLDQLAIAVGQVRAALEQHLVVLFEDAKDLEARYAAMDVDSSPVQPLRAEIKTLVSNPLYLDNIFLQRLDLLDAGLVGRVVPSRNPQDMYWYLYAAASAQKVTKEVLFQAVADFKAMGEGSSAEPLHRAIRLSFDQYSANLAKIDILQFLAVFAQLDDYIPHELQSAKHREYQEIASYWERYNNNSNLKVASEAELNQARAATDSALLKLFYANLIEVRASADELAGESGLKKMELASNVVREVKYDRANARIDIIFEQGAGQLSFIPVKTESGMIYVQSRPLALEQFIRLAKACGREVEDYLFSQDRLWPRPFEVTMGAGIATFNRWQFLNGDVFDPMVGFSARQIPAHVNRPEEILEIAKICGLRLFRPQEAADFIGKDSNYSRAPVDFNVANWPQLEESRTLKHSVYAQRLASVQSVRGIDFARGDVPANQFAEIIGGSAELVYDPDGDKYYAFGGSWLFTPQQYGDLELIEDPKRMYIDLGVRLVFNAPAPTYAELVEEVASQIIIRQRGLNP